THVSRGGGPGGGQAHAAAAGVSLRGARDLRRVPDAQARAAESAGADRLPVRASPHPRRRCHGGVKPVGERARPATLSEGNATILSFTRSTRYRFGSRCRTWAR